MRAPAWTSTMDMAGNPEYTVRVLAPLGRDAELACSALHDRGLFATSYARVDPLCGAISGGAGAVLVTQEALTLPRFPELLRLLEEQPPWSDLPIIVLVSLGSSDPELSRILAS